jgi:hypothetical protein
MLVGVGAYAVNAYLLKDVLNKINVCNDCRSGCIRRERIIFEGRP